MRWLSNSGTCSFWSHRFSAWPQLQGTDFRISRQLEKLRPEIHLLKGLMLLNVIEIHVIYDCNNSLTTNTLSNIQKLCIMTELVTPERNFGGELEPDQFSK